MSGKKDQIKGRIKEAAGTLIGDDEMRKEGKLEQVVGKVEETVEKTAKKVKAVIHKAVE